MTIAVNTLFLVAAVIFIGLSYATNAWARHPPGPGPGQPPFSVSLRLVYRLSIWLGPVALLGLAVHLALATVLQMGAGVSFMVLPAAIVLLLGACWLALQVWRQR